MSHWRKNWGPEPRCDLLKMDMVCTLSGKTRSPYRLPSALSKPQFNLATLLLCYKMNNCLWVHSQAHYCFYITSKNLRQAKDRALSIFHRNFTFPSSSASMLEAHFEDRSQSLTEDCLQRLHLHVRPGLLSSLALGILKSAIWIEGPFLFISASHGTLGQTSSHNAEMFSALGSWADWCPLGKIQMLEEVTWEWLTHPYLSQALSLWA